ncbi:hypothetical protein [Bradyrhizobium valentinum]|uniref:Uncharacterized protein n=1 Tax=Bradyrhizobium valentinum TaxID=1518501 RepID=A0A0R3L3F0_9BRAD|nr:hypothetical protein [Bradyrhizobium valentinum]KRR02107.1 hypothetical protein CP49_04830 [Bradyrhizobium valentinum]
MAAAGAATLYTTYQREYILTETAKAEFVGLQQSLHGLQNFTQSSGDGAFIALDKSMFDKMGAALTGQTVTVHSKELDDDIRLTVRSVTLRTEPGRMVARLDLTAADTKRGLAAGLDVEGFLIYAGTTEENSVAQDSPTDAANFKFIPVKVAPQLQYGFLNLRGRQLTSETITAGTLSFLFDKLALKATYRPHFSFSVGSPETITQHFGDNNSGTVELTAMPSPFHFDQWLTVVAPVFTPKGVVLTATLAPTRQAPSAVGVALPDTVNADDLSRARQEVQAKAGVLDGLFSRDVAVTIGRTAFTKLTDQLANTLAGFSISVQGKAISGRLFDKKWRDNILGEGGVFAEIRDAGWIKGRVNFAKPSVVLDQAQGPSLSLPVSASFIAPVHVHFDPLIGGGIGTSIGMQGSASTTLRAWFGTTKFPFEGRTVAVAGPVMSCGLLDIDARTDGKLKIGDGVATVPQFGAKVGVLVGSKPLAPSFIAGAPITMTILPPAKQDERSTARLSVVDGLYASLSLDDFAAEPSSDGYRLSSSFSVVLGNHPFQQPSSEYMERMRKAAIDHWNATMRQSCPNLPSIRIEVGDLEIGPNGEIMKFLRNAWNDITKGPGKNNEVVKLLGRIQAAAGSYDEATKKAANDVGDMARRAFPTDSGIGHAAGELGKSVTIAVTNPVAAVTGFFRQAGRLWR